MVFVKVYVCLTSLCNLYKQIETRKKGTIKYRSAFPCGRLRFTEAAPFIRFFVFFPIDRKNNAHKIFGESL